MSNLNIVKGKNLSASSTGYGEVKTNSRGGKSIPISYNSGPFRIQFPLMLCWGTNERVNEESGALSYDLALQFNSGATSQRRFLDNMKEFEEKVKRDAVSNSKKWFGKSKMSPEVVDALMYSILKYPKLKDGSGEPDYGRDPTLKLKIPFWENKFNVEIYDMSGKPLYLPQMESPEKTPVELIPKGSHIKGVLQCNGLWFAGGKFGITWKLLQCQARMPARLVGMGTCHIQEDSDDDEAENYLDKKEADQAAEDEEEEEEEVAQPEEEEDDEEEVAQEVEEEVQKAKPKKKKVVRRKKKSSE